MVLLKARYERATALASCGEDLRLGGHHGVSTEAANDSGRRQRVVLNAKLFHVMLPSAAIERPVQYDCITRRKHPHRM